MQRRVHRKREMKRGPAGKKKRGYINKKADAVGDRTTLDGALHCCISHVMTGWAQQLGALLA